MRQIKIRSRQWGSAARLGLLLGIMLIANLTGFMSLRTTAVGANMMLFWDGGAAPTGWSIESTYDGRFPRGESTANFGLTGGDGSRPFTPTVASTTISAPSLTAESGGTGSVSAATHTHPAPTVTIGTDSNGSLPAYSTLKLIKYNSGIPNIIPAGAIAMFAGSVPANFTRYSAQDSKVISVNSTAGSTGGGDTVTNSVAIGALGAASGGLGRSTLLASTPTAIVAHTHTAPANGTTAAVSALPPYVQPVLGKANVDTPTLSLDITAMFDADPGTGWVVQSNSGGAYNQKFLRPASTFSLTPLGAATRTDPNYTSGATGTAAGGNGGATLNLLNQNLAQQNHTHTITLTFDPVSNIPPYFNVVIAQKVNFTLTQYQWYVENGAENVTDKWPSGSLDVAVNSQIPSIPAPYNPPDINDQLRLRVQITVNGQALALNTVAFKLQYAAGTAASDCIQGTWLDVDSNASTARPWRYGSNGLTDGSTLITNKFTSNQLENFYRSAGFGAGFTNPAAASTGQTIEYDWLVQNYQATGAMPYNFRVVENQNVADSGILLSVYSTCPSVVTRPGTDQVLRHGEFFQESLNKGFLWVN